MIIINILIAASISPLPSECQEADVVHNEPTIFDTNVDNDTQSDITMPNDQALPNNVTDDDNGNDIALETKTNTTLAEPNRSDAAYKIYSNCLTDTEYGSVEV